MRKQTTRFISTFAGAAMIAVAGGCGGDGDSGSGESDDTALITAVATKAITTADPEVKCVEVVTTGFVKRVYSTLDQCRKAEAPDPKDDDNPTGASVSNVDVKGETATATVTVKGGSTDSSSGLLRFAKESGDWKVDDLDVTFLRSQLEKGFSNRTYTASDGPLVDPAFRSCVLKGLGALDDTTFKAVAFKSIADADPDPRFVEVFSTCQSTSTGPNADAGDLPEAPTKVRAAFETSLGTDAKKNGATDAQLTCVFKTLRRTLSDTEIARDFGTAGKADPSAPGTQKITAAIKACSSSSSSDGELPKAPTKIREQFEAGLLKSAAKSSAGTKKVNCILLNLRKSITDAEIVREVAKGADALSKADNPLTKKIKAAGEGC